MVSSAERRTILLVVAFVASLLTAIAAVFTAVTAAAPLPVARGFYAGAAAQPQARTVAAIALRWGVDADRIHVEWHEPLPAGGEGEVQLLGNGVRGQWLVDLRSADGAVHRGRLRAGVLMRVASAARDLPRGAIVAPADIVWAESVVWGPPPREPAPAPEGWETRRTVTAGEPLVPPAVAPPVWVRAGDDVRVIVARGALELTLAGRAAGSGAAGERVAVRAQTGKRITGIITAPGVVRVDAGKDH